MNQQATKPELTPGQLLDECLDALAPAVARLIEQRRAIDPSWQPPTELWKAAERGCDGDRENLRDELAAHICLTDRLDNWPFIARQEITIRYDGLYDALALKVEGIADCVRWDARLTGIDPKAHTATYTVEET